MIEPASGDVLLVVDVQHDFLEGGALGIARGSGVIAPLNRALDAFQARGLPVIATRDWHPPGHCSFRERGGPWPVHCVQGTHGAPGTILATADHTLVIACGRGAISVRDVHPSGKRRMSAQDWLKGRGATVGDRWE